MSEQERPRLDEKLYVRLRGGTYREARPEERTREERLREALERIADPDWASIYPPDVFRETKRIARKALTDE